MNTTSQATEMVTTGDGYDQWAAIYDEFENPLTSMVASVLRRPAFDIGGARVLELGCGTGRNIDRLFEQRIRSYVGIDASAEMLAIANHRRHASSEVTLRHHELCDAWWSDAGQYDLVLVSLVLGQFEVLEPILRSAGQVVGPGGALWILEAHPEVHASSVDGFGRDKHGTLAVSEFAHTSGDLRTALSATGWDTVATTQWCPTTSQAARNGKLNRYLGRPVLIEVRATRPG